jgi:uncharacterized protein YuzE
MRLQYRSELNTLRLTLDVEQGAAETFVELVGIIDIAEQGRLVGIELETNELRFDEAAAPWLADAIAGLYIEVDGERCYVALSAPGENLVSEHLRSANVRVQAELDTNGKLVALSIPRRGHGYEISFPSGNR